MALTSIQAGHGRFEEQRSDGRGARWICAAALFSIGLIGIAAEPNSPRPPGRVLTREGTVEYRRPGSTAWYEAPTKHVLETGDRLRTSDNGRATVELRDYSVIRLNPRSDLVITPPRRGTSSVGFNFKQGLLYFFHRGRPGEVDVDTPVAIAAIEGTEFSLAVAEDGRTVLTVLDGRVALSNAHGAIALISGEQAEATAGAAPRKTAVIEARNAIQWCLYYPGVLDPAELGLNPGAASALRESLNAYRAGNLLQAMNAYPANRVAASAEERLYLAGLKLSTGRAVDPAGLIESRDANHRLAIALRLLRAAVEGGVWNAASVPEGASQWLALSYLRQSQHDLKGALDAAKTAMSISTNFGFALARVAELEFSFGRVRPAEHALQAAIRASPQNAQAHALHGFLLLAKERRVEANTAFETAIHLDPMLGNALLGRGLARIRGGDVVAGRSDLQVAAVLEPTRWLLRSYLGKAYAHEALFASGTVVRRDLLARARAELALARARDPMDPTPWLYSALLNYDELRTKEAIRDLEESAARNDNRQVYRSRLLLDQDRAVRSANLASIFDDAGMNDVSVRESARAVSFDYANFSAHMNLAASYNTLRDPTRFNLRYESEWFNEHLLATLLAPVGVGALSQNLSQQEYARMFAGDRLGFTSTSEYYSDGEYRQLASQFGTFGRFSYALDLDYAHQKGVRPNNDLDRIEWYSRFKQQITAEDSVLLLTKYQDYDAGDNFQYYDPASARPAFRFAEVQTPMVLAGWHHEWSPGMHTLFLGGRLHNDQTLSDLDTAQLAAFINPPGGTFVPFPPFDVTYQSQFEIYTAEIQQIAQRETHTDIFGLRYQRGRIEAESTLDNQFPLLYPVPLLSTVDSDFERISGYLYHHWRLGEQLVLIGGVAYDSVTFPANFRRPPLEGRETTRDQVSPKAAVIWNAKSNLTVRGMYAEALGGVSYDESVRLEPTQLVGFGQTFRSLISESLVGSVEAPSYRIGGLALDWKPFPQTWAGLVGQWSQGQVDRDIGILSFDPALFPLPPASPAMTREVLDYHEWSATAVLNQIVGDSWFLGARYQFTRSELSQSYPAIPLPPGGSIDSRQWANLHDLRLTAAWRPPSGWFVQGELAWFAQTLGGSSPQPPGDEFPQFNLFTGYRFPNRRGDITLGVLNLTDENYRLSPLNYYLEMTRERVFYARLRLNF